MLFPSKLTIFWVIEFTLLILIRINSNTYIEILRLRLQGFHCRRLIVENKHLSVLHYTQITIGIVFEHNILCRHMSMCRCKPFSRIEITRKCRCQLGRGYRMDVYSTSYGRYATHTAHVSDFLATFLCLLVLWFILLSVKVRRYFQLPKKEINPTIKIIIIVRFGGLRSC